MADRGGGRWGWGLLFPFPGFRCGRWERRGSGRTGEGIAERINNERSAREMQHVGVRIQVAHNDPCPLFPLHGRGDAEQGHPAGELHLVGSIHSDDATGEAMTVKRIVKRCARGWVITAYLCLL